jgi:ATP-binding cassette subfamily B protein
LPHSAIGNQRWLLGEGVEAIVEREPERSDTAFKKACAYLNFHAKAKWAAHLAAGGTALVYVALLIVLWLFIDLMVSRGRIPDYQELTPLQQQEFDRTWGQLSADQRAERVKALDLEERTRQRLANIEQPSQAGDAAELLWEAQVRHILLEQVGPAAVDRVFTDNPRLHAAQADTHARAATSTLGLLVARSDGPWLATTSLIATRRPVGHVPFDVYDNGILSLVVREKASGRVLSPVPWLSRHVGWMWNAPPTAPTLLPTYLTGLFLVAVVLALAGALLSLLMREMAARATIEATTRIRRAVYHHTFRLGTLAVRALGPSEAVSILTRHVEALHDALYTRLTAYFREPAFFGVLVLFALIVHPLLSLAFLMFAVVVWLLGAQIVAYFRQRAKLATNQAAERLTIIRESLMLMRLVKCFLMEQFNQARVERQLSRYAQVQLVRHRGEAIYLPLLIFLGLFAALVLLYVGALIVLRGQLSVAGAVVLATALLSLYRPVERWLEARRLLRRGRESAEQIFKFLERRGEVGQVVGAEFLPPLSRQIEFDNVSLRDASTGRLLLEDVSINIQAGQRIGLIGADNLEKHALVYLIPRLLDPTAGEVRIDQHNLRWVTLDSLRAQIGIVMMHNLVFHDSVANNIGCGDSAYTLPQIIEAAKMAHAHHFIQKLPQGYETPLGELGHSLSVSEQFRIALARAILRDPALLIVEEPETDLDEDSKNLLDDTLVRVLPGRTAIFLPHRISTIRSCDMIYLVNKGRVVASGVHKDLLKQNKLYRHLHYLEFNEVDELV